jgi:ribosomal protein L11 methyltransferase
VLASLIELAPAGFERVDGEGFVEFAVYGAPGEVPSLPQGPAEVGGVSVTVRGDTIADDWAERWRAFHRPAMVGGRLWVRPPWEPPTEDPGVTDLVIDPGAAFGTGTHPTTRLCLELLLGVEPGGSLVDLGCGSGVLAIAAAKLGFDPVFAVDFEQAAVEATAANAVANEVQLARVERRDLRRDEVPGADVVIANLTGPLLRRLAPGIETAAGSVALLSGILEPEAGGVAAAFAGLEERNRLMADGWSGLLLARTQDLSR